MRVQDIAPGVPVEMQIRIFAPFVTARGQDEGTGLGLPLCRKLIEARQGRIDPEPGDKGAGIRLFFPRFAAQKYFDKDRADSLG